MAQHPRPNFSIPLREILHRDGNNLDTVRLFCAILVLFGHSFGIAGDPGYQLEDWDPFTQLHYEGFYSASVAVKVFFFISGLLVTNSLLKHNSLTRFTFGRFLRIWPGLAAMSLVACLLLGPLVGAIPVREYFTSPGTVKYLISQLCLQSTDRLPGVFTSNPLPELVNGALWSLRYEVAAYVAVLLLHVLGVLRRPWLATLLGLLVIADPVWPRPLLFPWLHINPQFVHLPSCFAFGALLAVHRERLRLSPLIVVATCGAFFLGRHVPVLGPTLFLFALFLLLLYLAALSARLPLHPRIDLSYGTFLWGFPVQQTLASLLPNHSYPWHLGLALAITLLLAFASWQFVERPAQGWGHRLAAQYPLDFDSIPRRILVAAAILLCTFGWMRIGPWHAPTAVIPGTEHRVLYGADATSIHPPFTRIWALRPSVGRIVVKTAFAPEACVPGRTNGADLILEIHGPFGPTEVLRRRIDPVRNPADNGVVTTSVTLPPFPPGARLGLRTEAGADGDAAWDWLFLTGIRFESGPELAGHRFPGFNRIPEVAALSFSMLLPEDGGLMLHAPADIRFPLTGNEQRVRMSVGLLPSAYEGGGQSDGVVFHLDLLQRDKVLADVGILPLNPLQITEHRGVQQFSCELPSVRRGTRLRLRVEAGPQQNNAWDQAYVRSFEID